MITEILDHNKFIIDIIGPFVAIIVELENLAWVNSNHIINAAKWNPRCRIDNKYIICVGQYSFFTSIIINFSKMNKPIKNDAISK